MTSLQSYIRRSRQNHIFRVSRYVMRFVVAPFFVLFGVVDYMYQPENFVGWMSLRLAFIAVVFMSFEVLKKKSIRVHFAEWIAIANIAIACNIVTYMIWSTGGASSLYVTGLILVSMTGVQIYRLDGKWALRANVLSYFPAAVVTLISAWPEQILVGVIHASFFLGITFLSYVFRSSDDQVVKKNTLHKMDMKNQLEVFRKTEFMKSHFPKTLREQVENNQLTIDKRKVYSSAVVGFVDIAGSTTIANTLTLLADWQLKEKFIEAAAKRAVSCNLTVLSHLGDGFMFLANFNEQGDWPLNVLSFYEGLSRDFDILDRAMGLGQGGLDTGLKFGIAMGPAVVGFLGEGQSYFTAMGPDVNLAARLCDQAAAGELVLSSRTWNVIRHVAMGWDANPERLRNLKGFDNEIPVVRIHPRSTSEQGMACPSCGAEMSIGRNHDGFIEAICPSEDQHEKFEVKRSA